MIAATGSREDLAGIIRAGNAIVPEGRLVVALSGGADSAVAGLVATRLEPSRDVVAVFVDHGWEHSGKLEAAAREVAARLDIAIEVVAIESTATETSARTLRLAALERVAAGRPIVTGHHAGDVAETALLNLARGAGSAGLGSIPAVRQPYVRPLVAVRGETVRRIAGDLRLPYLDDPANDDPRHARTTVRRRVMPALEAVAPGASASIVRSAAHLAADDELLADRADAVPLWSETGAVGIPAAALTMLPEPIASRIVRRALRSLRPPYAGSAADVAMVLRSVDGPGGEVGGGLRVSREGAAVVIHDPAATPAPLPEAPLPVPGEHVGPTHRLTADTGGVGSSPLRHRGCVAVAVGARPELIVRSARPGERIDIGVGSKPVRDAMAEAGVPVRLRAAWPVVARHGKIAWIAGVRTSAWATPDQSDDRVVRLTTERLRWWTA